MAAQRRAARRPNTTRRKAPSRTGSRSAGRSVGRRNVILELNLFLVIATVVVGAILWFLELIAYNAQVEVMSRVLLIGLIFLGLSLAVGIFVLCYSNASGNFEQNVLTGSSGGLGSAIVTILLGSVLVFLLAMLFQFIYGMDFRVATSSEPTSYIFVIDDSGSMASNDPDGLRYEAIEEVLSDKDDDFQYMVYSFASGVSIVRDMAPISDGLGELSGNSSGGTSMKAALQQVLDDYENGVWDGGSTPKVVLLTDGYATDIISIISPIDNLLKKYSQAGISISTVGLGSVDEALMNKIADSTGGVFVLVSEASQLSSAMLEAALNISESGRDLLTTRYTNYLNPLYGFLRILFLSILGILIGFIAMVAYGRADANELILVSSVITAVVGALLMEAGTGLLGLPSLLMWLFLWILLAVTIAVKTNTRIRPKDREIGR